MTEDKITIKRVCECQNCGNEAEMIITCALPEAGADPMEAPAGGKVKTQIRGHATCSHCGGEADMWIDDL